MARTPRTQLLSPSRERTWRPIFPAPKSLKAKIRKVPIRATVDVEDTSEVLDILIDRLLELEVEQGLPVYFVASRSVQRTLEELQRRPRG
jgi:hypothetical protein